jgi:hypothetical protein
MASALRQQLGLADPLPLGNMASAALRQQLGLAVRKGRRLHDYDVRIY